MPRVAIDALSLRGGGGLTYLTGLLDHLPGIWHGDPLLVLAPLEFQERLALRFSSTRIFGLHHVSLPRRVVWQQFQLAGWMRSHRVDLLLAAGNIGPVVRSHPFVLVVQNVDPLLSLPRGVPIGFAAKMKGLRALTVASIRKARAVIAVSQYARRLIIEACAPSPPEVSVVHLGRPDDAEHPTAAGSNGSLASLGVQRPYVLAVSSIKFNKNFPRLVAAFAAARTADHDLVIAGGLEHSWAVEETLTEIRRWRLGRRVHLLGGVDRPTVRRLYSGATALVFPSLVESFGLPVLEAMAYGVPVTASQIDPVREICGDAALYFDPTSAESMAEAISRIVQDEVLRQGLARAGQVRSRRFTWAAAASNTRDVLVADMNR